MSKVANGHEINLREWLPAATQDLNGDYKIDTENRASVVVCDLYGDFVYYAYVSALKNVIKEENDSASIIIRMVRSRSKCMISLTILINIEKFREEF